MDADTLYTDVTDQRLQGISPELQELVVSYDRNRNLLGEEEFFWDSFMRKLRVAVNLRAAQKKKDRYINSSWFNTRLCKEFLRLSRSEPHLIHIISEYDNDAAEYLTVLNIKLIADIAKGVITHGATLIDGLTNAITNSDQHPDSNALGPSFDMKSFSYHKVIRVVIEELQHVHFLFLITCLKKRNLGLVLLNLRYNNFRYHASQLSIDSVSARNINVRRRENDCRSRSAEISTFAHN